MRHLLIVSTFALFLCGCPAGGRNRPVGRDGAVPTDAGVMDGAPPIDTGRPPIPDSGPYDPFDPDASCGLSIVPTERVPGSLLLVFDRSGSMSDPPGGGSSGPSKWELGRSAINTVLSSAADDLGAGLLLFPTGEGPECNVSLSATVPQVPVAPLSTSRSMISSALTSATPSGGVTPIFDAVRAGYDYLDTLDTIGQRGLVVVTDGAENCDESDRDAVLAQVSSELADNHYMTFVVGLTQSDNVLSTMAFNGGTARNDTCLPECTTDLCSSDSDCPGAATCATIISGFPGFCSCMTDADCPPPLRCTTIPFLGGQCSGDANCCHYSATASSFAADFEAALDEIARRFLESCVFDLPRGTDPSMFDPALVNVGVTFDGEARTVLRRGDDATMDSWSYTTSDYDSIIIQGPICDRLLMGGAVVEIVLGCPTILI